MERVNRIYLVRHGQVVGYENFPAYGHTDADLTEVGILQLEHVAERVRFSDIKAIYASDLKRSVTGARIVARHHDVPLFVLPELREVYFGAWEGLTFPEIRERFPEAVRSRETDLLNFRPPGDGESVRQLSARILACLKEILSAQNGNDILVVGHGAVNRVILCNALNLDLSHMFNLYQDYGCLNIIDYYPERAVVKLVNG